MEFIILVLVAVAVVAFFLVREHKRIKVTDESYAAPYKIEPSVDLRPLEVPVEVPVVPVEVPAAPALAAVPAIKAKPAAKPRKPRKPRAPRAQ